MKRVMILLLMINITNATFCEVPEANSWLLPVFIALFIGLLLSIIGYFVSLFLNSPKMAAWAKVEVSHLGTAAFIAILIYGVMTFSCDNNATLVLGASFWPTPYNESITPQNFFNASADYFDGVANTSYKAIKMMRYNLAGLCPRVNQRVRFTPAQWWSIRNNTIVGWAVNVMVKVP